MRFVHKSTGIEVAVGDKVRERTGHEMVVSGFAKPTSPASTGRVYVKPDADYPDLHAQGFFPDVYDCEWIEREDRA